MNFLPVVTALLLFLVQTVAAAPQSGQSGPDAAADEHAATLGALAESLDSDFEAALPRAAELFADPEQTPELRARALIETIAAAHAASRLDIEDQAGPAYQELADTLSAGELRSKLHRAYGNLNLWRGRFDVAESLFRRAAAEHREDDTAVQADLKNSLGVALAQQGKLDEALGTMLAAFRLFEQTEAGPSANLLRNIGGLSIYLEDWDQAVEFTRLALDKTAPDDPQITGLYSNLAAALIEQDQPEEATEVLETAIAIGEAQGRPSAAVVSNLGYVVREQGRLEEALTHFRRAVAIDRAEGDTGSMAITLKNMGETLIQLGRREEADTVLQESMAAYRQADIKPKRLELYPVLVENLEQLGRYPEALAMMREYRELSEEIASADAQARVAELQGAFDLERKERELAESERERLASETRLASIEAAQTRQQHLRTLLTTGVVALALILLLLLRLLQLRTRANRLLAEKNAEIDQQHRALEESHIQLQRHSIEDELTSLGNRRFVRQLLVSALPDALVDSPALLVLIDLDRFKGINDTFGHPVGDRVLARFAETLRQVAGPDDILARWGGEEFLWLIPAARMTEAADRCRNLADRVRATEFMTGGRSLSITCSMGVAPVDLDADDPQAAFDLALKIADAALYEAKDSGRNGWAGFERRVDDPKIFEGSLDIEALVARGALARRRLEH
ncbi:tetratricopeptide repeat-containing diguanylate cyclase [Wenzhouxiangella sediminis]|nr:tetratricopeptide repeat-containing diguanylate cyclase [Wenzhouxiangella sediminis]